MFSVEIYLHKLGLKKEDPTLGFLQKFIKCHLAKFSFNNLDIFFSGGKILDLKEDALFERVILNEEGGYCFELNKLFFLLLKDLGFSVNGQMARVNYGSSDLRPRTHRFSVVVIEGFSYLVDVGFGPYTPNGPINMNGKEHDFGGRLFRIEKMEECFCLFIKKELKFFQLYNFELSTNFNEKDFDIANYYTSTHPKSKFVNELIISKIFEGEVQFFSINKFVKLSGDIREELDITSNEEFHNLLIDLGLSPSILQRSYKLF